MAPDGQAIAGVKINWFSPLPPARARAAFITEQIVPLLAKHAEIRVWSHEPSWKLETYATVKTYDAATPPWRDFNRAEVAIFHLGDEAQFYGDVWAVSREYPGIVVLHDDSFQQLFTGLATRRRFLNQRDYLRLAEFHYPRKGRAMGEAYLSGTISVDALALQCSMIRAAVENALAVVVHSQTTFDALAGDSLLPVVHLPIKENDDGEAYAESLLEMANELPAYQKIWSARVLSRSVGGAIHDWCTDDPMADLPPGIAREILVLSEGNELFAFDETARGN